MSANTKIEWADHTWNPWIGCTKVGPGCDNCYAKADFEDRKHRVVWGAAQARSRTKTWGDPVRWNRQHEAFFAEHGRRQRVFCASLADVFDNEVPVQWRIELMRLICETPHLDWLLLTKRIGNADQMLETAFRAAHQGREGWRENYLPNVWIGATIVNQSEADRDIPKLLAVPAARRFLSMEPLLGPVDLNYTRQRIQATRSQLARAINGETWIDWVIVGGESGPNARPMHPEWARSLRDQCKAAGVPLLFKQWGEWICADQDECPHGPPKSRWMWADGAAIEFGDGDRAMPLFCRAGKKAAGRLLDGREWNGVPT